MFRREHEPGRSSVAPQQEGSGEARQPQTLEGNPRRRPCRVTRTECGVGAQQCWRWSSLGTELCSPLNSQAEVPTLDVMEFRDGPLGGKSIEIMRVRPLQRD